MKKIKSEPILIMGVLGLALVVGILVGVLGNNSSNKKSALEKDLDKELSKMQAVYDPFVDVEDKDVSSGIKNEQPVIAENIKNEVGTNGAKEIIEYSYPCDKNGMKIVDHFDKKYSGIDKGYLDTLIMTPAFNKGCPGIVFRVNEKSSAYSIAEGVVVNIIDNTAKKSGYTVEVENVKGFKTVFAGLSDVVVSKNEKINKGQKVGSIGDINNVLLNNELRFYILEGNVIIDPGKYIGR